VEFKEAKELSDVDTLGYYFSALSNEVNLRGMVNNYWNKAFTAYWQNYGLNIYPNVTWSLPDSYEYSVAGLPRHSVISINSMGVPKYDFSISLWLQGYRYMVDTLEPTMILRYGPKINGEDENISLYLENVQLNILRDGSKRK